MSSSSFALAAALARILRYREAAQAARTSCPSLADHRAFEIRAVR